MNARKIAGQQGGIGVQVAVRLDETAVANAPDGQGFAERLGQMTAAEYNA